MTTARYSRAPSGPGVIKTTQRVNETLDYADGLTDQCFDLFAREKFMDDDDEYVVTGPVPPPAP